MAVDRNTSRRVVINTPGGRVPTTPGKQQIYILLTHTQMY